MEAEEVLEAEEKISESRDEQVEKLEERLERIENIMQYDRDIEQVPVQSIEVEGNELSDIVSFNEEEEKICVTVGYEDSKFTQKFEKDFSSDSELRKFIDFVGVEPEKTGDAVGKNVIVDFEKEEILLPNHSKLLHKAKVKWVSNSITSRFGLQMKFIGLMCIANIIFNSLLNNIIADISIVFFILLFLSFCITYKGNSLAEMLAMKIAVWHTERKIEKIS